MRTPRLPVLILGLCLSGGASASAQDRATLVGNAEFSLDNQEAAELYARALDLDLGPPDSLWAQALVGLAVTLRDNLDRPDAADLWLRWGARLYPDVMEFDNPSWDVVARGALDRILTELGDAPPDSLAQWTWDWSGVQLTGNGTLRLNRQDVAPGVMVEVGTSGQLANQMNMAPGTYEIRILAGDNVISRYEQEVLPGVTATMNLTVPADVLAARLPDPGGIPGGPGAAGAAAGGGGFPIAVAVVGILAAGGAAAFVLGSSGGDGGGNGNNTNPTTGGIIINYPRN